MRGRSLRRAHLTGGVRGRAWPVGRWGSNPRPADYEKYGPAHRTHYLHGYREAAPLIVTSPKAPRLRPRRCRKRRWLRARIRLDSGKSLAYVYDHRWYTLGTSGEGGCQGWGCHLYHLVGRELESLVGRRVSVWF